jgi:ubiquinone/menaquinone biosynthesis C-methylase UbiE
MEDPITRELYDSVTATSLPEGAVLASLGCGNPTALAELKPGEIVLDLGSGGGIDVLLSARRVGPTGKAYGLDMTDEMLELARRNAAEAGALPGGASPSSWDGGEVEFLKGEIEAIPLPAASVDVIISNCVINLSRDKRAVIREAARVLRPGGRFAVSDVVAKRELPPVMRENPEIWSGCVGGALQESEYLALLTEAGFTDGTVEETRGYTRNDAREMLEQAGLDVEAHLESFDGAIMAAFVRATKPAG